MSSPLLEQLIEAFRCLPGVGNKSAQRMAYHLLERNREGGLKLAGALAEAIERIGHCEQCRDFSEEKLCATCASAARERNQLCAVGKPGRPPGDRAGDRLSRPVFHPAGPLVTAGWHRSARARPRPPGDAPGPGRGQGVDHRDQPDRRRRATAHYLAQLARQVRCPTQPFGTWRPLGGELEYVDRGTLAHAFGSRTEVGP